jgi:lipid-binding SYLF domain-containing protein
MPRNRGKVRLRPAGLAGLLISLLVALGPTHAVAGDFSKQQELVDRARLTFEKFLSDQENLSWYRRHSRDIKAVFIVPQLLRGAFLVGAAGGSGVLLAHDFVKGGWSPPAFYRMSETSIGVQAGADASEVVLAVLTSSALERFHGGGTVKLGVDSGITLGIGGGGTTGVDIESFAWSKGVFFGLSFEGFAVTASSGDNKAYYGASVEPEQILANGPVTNPGADELRATMARLLYK